MTDRPILFSAPMVRALLAGTKTQTRRVIKPRGENSLFAPGMWADSYVLNPGNAEWRAREISFTVGDRLWVREQYYQFGHWEPVIGAKTKGGQQKWAFVGVDQMVTFEQPAECLASRNKAFPGLPRWYKRLGRFMPRRYSRLTLTVTDVRVERLQDISEADAIAEGIEPAALANHWRDYGPDPLPWASPVESYRSLWDSINGPSAWDANPWVVAVSFDVLQGNIDA